MPIPTTETWYGMTYAEDRKTVKEAIAGLIEQGIYPGHLWGFDIIATTAIPLKDLVGFTFRKLSSLSVLFFVKERTLNKN